MYGFGKEGGLEGGRIIPGSCALAVASGARIPDRFVGHGCGWWMLRVVLGYGQRVEENELCGRMRRGGAYGADGVVSGDESGAVVVARSGGMGCGGLSVAAKS